jgi:hypothetical protein
MFDSLDLSDCSRSTSCAGSGESPAEPGVRCSRQKREQKSKNAQGRQNKAHKRAQVQTSGVCVLAASFRAGVTLDMSQTPSTYVTEVSSSPDTSALPKPPGHHFVKTRRWFDIFFSLSFPRGSIPLCSGIKNLGFFREAAPRARGIKESTVTIKN